MYIYMIHNYINIYTHVYIFCVVSFGTPISWRTVHFSTRGWPASAPLDVPKAAAAMWTRKWWWNTRSYMKTSWFHQTWAKRRGDFSVGWCPLEAVPHESIHRSPTSSTQRWLENPNGNGCFFNVLTGASWCPPRDVCWFTNHRNSIDISTINHSWTTHWGSTLREPAKNGRFTSS